ncbi:1,6-anhydro-N-acetylmuramyl-L-alanine amidase AmpD [Aeromonas diversa]|uniref:1,6-anhydro-N-acetylmuramyl-L-alanine amidase AmpD n=1 Tax=Aeromonas diversa TaxID=502790 RepID=UPI0039A1C5FE
MTQPNTVFSIDSDGWCQQARQVPSPHHNDRPQGESISLLVVHNISLPPGEFGGPWIDDLFLGRLNPAAHPYFAQIHQLRVSAHCLIRRDGELVQYVPFHLRAWHAGVSSFEGREACNDFSIGIELEGTDSESYTESQYRVLQGITRALMAHYPSITAERITGHSDIAPGRKSDPGPSFDWAHYRSGLVAPS